MTEIVIIGRYSTFNFGDVAMLLSFLELFEDSGRDLEVTVFSRTPRFISSSLNEIETRNLKIKFVETPVDLAKEIMNSKAVLLGGGSLFSPTAKPENFLPVALFKKIFNKNLYVLSVDGLFWKSLPARIILKAASRVIYRVPVPEEVKSGLEEKIELLPDVATVYFLRDFKRPYFSRLPQRCAAVVPLWAEKKVWEKIPEKCQKLYQDLRGLPKDSWPEYKTAKGFFSRLFEYRRIYTYHYHTGLFCKLYGIEYVRLQDTLKHRSLDFWTKKDLEKAPKKWIEVIKEILEEISPS